MIKKDKKLILIVALFIIIILAFGFTMVKLINENQECIINPLVYGAKQISKQGITVLCTCEIEEDNYDPFWFNNETMEVVGQELTFNYNYTL